MRFFKPIHECLGILAALVIGAQFVLYVFGGVNLWELHKINNDFFWAVMSCIGITSFGACITREVREMIVSAANA